MVDANVFSSVQFIAKTAKDAIDLGTLKESDTIYTMLNSIRVEAEITVKYIQAMAAREVKDLEALFNKAREESDFISQKKG